MGKKPEDRRQKEEGRVKMLGGEREWERSSLYGVHWLQACGGKGEYSHDKICLLRFCCSVVRHEVG